MTHPVKQPSQLVCRRELPRPGKDMTAHANCRDAGLDLDDGTVAEIFIHPSSAGMSDDAEILMVRRGPADAFSSPSLAWGGVGAAGGSSSSLTAVRLGITVGRARLTESEGP